jgi:2-dehydro-3-deoxygluconokinase
VTGSAVPGSAVPVTPDVVTFGEAMCLMRAEADQPLRGAQRFVRTVAGAESNLAIGLARLGERVGWLGRVGDDALGLGILDTLRGENVDVSRCVTDPTRPTGVLVRDSHAQRQIQVVYARSGSAGGQLGPADLDLPYLTSARLVHVTGITPALSPAAREATYAAVAAATAAGVPVCFDPNIRRRLWPSQDAAVAALRPIAAAAAIISAGLDEARALTGRTHRADVAAFFLADGARLVILRLGDKGAWGTDGTRSWHSPAAPVTVRDPIGAGDAFNAGFLAAWLSGGDPLLATDQGNLVAGLSVQVPGDYEGYPYLAELAARRLRLADADR